MHLAQLEFPLISIHFPAGTTRLPVRKPHPSPAPDPHPDPVILSAALVAENISFITFAILLAIHRHKAPMPIAKIAKSTGQSYFAVRSQIVNNIYFDFIKPSRNNALPAALASAALNHEAERKLQRIEKRLSP